MWLYSLFIFLFTYSQHFNRGFQQHWRPLSLWSELPLLLAWTYHVNTVSPTGHDNALSKSRHLVLSNNLALKTQMWDMSCLILADVFSALTQETFLGNVKWMEGSKVFCPNGFMCMKLQNNNTNYSVYNEIVAKRNWGDYHIWYPLGLNRSQSALIEWECYHNTQERDISSSPNCRNDFLWQKFALTLPGVHYSEINTLIQINICLRRKYFVKVMPYFDFLSQKIYCYIAFFFCFIWKLYKHKPFAPVIWRTRSEPQAQQPRLSLSQGLEHFGISRQPENRSIRWLPLCSGIHKLPLPTAIRWISRVAYVIFIAHFA